MKLADRLAIAIGVKPTSQWIAEKICPRCRLDVSLAVMSEIDNKEHLLSGFCKTCIDVVFAGKPDPAGTDTSEFYAVNDRLLQYMIDSGREFQT